MDYASVIWFPKAAAYIRRMLEPAQRMAAQAIKGGFRSIALPVLEAEAWSKHDWTRNGTKRSKYD